MQRSVDSANVKRNLLRRKMDINEFREFGHAAIEFLVEYLETIRDRFVPFVMLLNLIYSLIVK